ncbi:MAG TPA: response regulator [Dehalococcoidia bacterium]|nr:response regulator [Dehalococcoidia bacterium]
MQAANSKNRRALSHLQIGLLVAVAFLAVSVEILIIRAYVSNDRTADFFSFGNFVTTDLANLQREALLLQLETNKYFQNPGDGSQSLELRRAILGNQIRMQIGQAHGNAYVVGELGRIGETLKEYDALMAPVFEGGSPGRAGLEFQADDILAGLERQIKFVYDGEEFNLFRATSVALDAQRNSALMLLALAGLVLALGVVLGFSMSRSVRALRIETIERAKAEETIRQLAETLELRVIERTTELSDTLEQLEDVSRHKSEFLAHMSHELRTPLNAIIGYSEMLQEEAEDAHQDGIVSDLQKIGSSGNHLLDLVNDVLDFSKIEAGKMELYLETFSVPSMLKDVADVIRPLAEKNESTLEVHCDDSVGLIHADVTKVRQTLFNLLGNACKFTHGGAITLGVIRSHQDGVDWINFIVSDTGIGINPQHMSRLFQPFSQADSSTTRRYGGTGLGLVLSRQFCQMMGGDITVESEEGKGSTFTCTLPAVVRPATDELNMDHNSGLALVIDGDEATRNVTRHLLMEAGFRVACSDTGEEGLLLARELRPDVITLDVFIPGMNAWEVLTRLKSAPDLADIRVIMLAGADHQELGLALDATDFLVEPVDRQRLASILRRHRPRQAPYTALVVEDDAANRESVGRMLEQEGWAVLQAEDGSGGLKRLEEIRPDLILLDLFMPGMDGFEFLEELAGREEWSGLPVVVIVGQKIDAKNRKRLNQRVNKVIGQRSNGTQQVLQEIFGQLGVSSREPETSDQGG